MTEFWERAVRAARLDGQLYEAVEADPAAFRQAMAMVVLSSVAAGLGIVSEIGVDGVLLGTLAALLGWVLWALLVYWIGGRFLRQPQTQTSLGELLRTLGFASSPGMIRILAAVPGMAQPVFLLAEIWMLAAMVVAVKHALDYTGTARAAAVCFFTWLVQWLAFQAMLSLAP